jgi:threonylcarbamoyladenosine tRNA methylthiotransferase MtaB
MRVAFYTLGCKVNQYETDLMMKSFVDKGYDICDFKEKADIYVINSCSVTNLSTRKTRQYLSRAKKMGGIVVLAGCYAQEIEKDEKLENVDVIIGNQEKNCVVETVEEYIKNKEGKTLYKVTEIGKLKRYVQEEKLNLGREIRESVKIEDGCNNFCSYCIIPYTRGNVRNKKKQDVLTEVNNLVLNGHKEIVLTGIHTGSYNDSDYDFASLLNDLVKIEGLKRIRISSIEITEINDRVLEVFKNSNILVNHIHIPLQSGSDTILKLMNRKYDKEYFINKINEIRNIRPSISITTDVIVGFPFETEELFNETIDTIKKVNFSALHVFPYSKREGTKAASMTNQIDDVTKKIRVHKLLELSKELQLNYFNEFLNKTLEFIPETYKDGYLIGHTGNYLQIKAKGDESLINKIVKVKIENIDYPYCVSKIVEK